MSENAVTNGTRAPLVAPEVDLRDFAFMPVDVHRLLTSETWMTSSGDEKAAAMTLWLESWRQVPAGSLPDNDRMLAHLSQAGSKWRRVKAIVMRGWIKCSDGRFYHPVVAEKANEAWTKKIGYRDRLETARDAKRRKAEETERQKREAATAAATGSAKANGTHPPPSKTGSMTEPDTDLLTGHKGEGQGEGQGQGDSKPSPDFPNGKSSAAAHGRRDRDSVTPNDPRKAFYDLGKNLLGSTSGGLLTKLAKALDADYAKGSDILGAAKKKADPREFIAAVIRTRAKNWENDWDNPHRIDPALG